MALVAVRSQSFSGPLPLPPLALAENPNRPKGRRLRSDAAEPAVRIHLAAKPMLGSGSSLHVRRRSFAAAQAATLPCRAGASHCRNILWDMNVIACIRL